MVINILLEYMTPEDFETYRNTISNLSEFFNKTRTAYSNADGSTDTKKYFDALRTSEEYRNISLTLDEITDRAEEAFFKENQTSAKCIETIKKILDPINENDYFLWLLKRRENDKYDKDKNPPIERDTFFSSSSSFQRFLSGAADLPLSIIPTLSDHEDATKACAEIFKTKIEEIEKKIFPEDSAPEQMTISDILEPVLPSRHYMANPLLMNKVFNPNTELPLNEWLDFDITGKNDEQKGIINHVILNYSDSLLSHVNLTEYERQVHDAIVSLYISALEQGLPPVFSEHAIYRAMPGSGTHQSPQQKAALTKAMNKMDLRMKIDLSNQLRKMGKISDNEEFFLDRHLISFSRGTLRTANGRKKADSYIIDKEPIMLTYAKATNNEILTVNSKHLELKELSPSKKELSSMAMKMNPERQAITGFLLRHICVIKNKQRNKQPFSDVIKFSTIYESVGITTTSRTQLSRYRQFILDVLFNFKATGFIEDYMLIAKGNEKPGVKIITKESEAKQLKSKN